MIVFVAAKIEHMLRVKHLNEKNCISTTIRTMVIRWNYVHISRGNRNIRHLKILELGNSGDSFVPEQTMNWIQFWKHDGSRAGCKNNKKLDFCQILTNYQNGCNSIAHTFTDTHQFDSLYESDRNEDFYYFHSPQLTVSIKPRNLTTKSCKWAGSRESVLLSDASNWKKIGIYPDGSYGKLNETKILMLHRVPK